MRRARYLAGADTSLEVESARECRCCPATPTSTCAPARHAGLSTNYCMDHQVSSSNVFEGFLLFEVLGAEIGSDLEAGLDRNRLVARSVIAYGSDRADQAPAAA